MAHYVINLISQKKFFRITSNSAVIVLAFLLTKLPTALKFLSRSSPYNSSEELRMIFFFSVGASSGDWLLDTNFSGGSFTLATRHYTATVNHLLFQQTLFSWFTNCRRVHCDYQYMMTFLIIGNKFFLLWSSIKNRLIPKIVQSTDFFWILSEN